MFKCSHVTTSIIYMTSEITDKDIKTVITNTLPMSKRYKLKRDTQKALKGNNNNNKTSRDEKNNFCYGKHTNSNNSR